MQTSIFIVFAVAGAVEFLRRLQVKDYFAAITIFVSAAIGLVAGAFGAPGVSDAWNGVIAGIAASGLVTVASRVSTTYTLKKS